jgi:hypothetical protein
VPPPEVSEDYAVYSAVLRHYTSGKKAIVRRKLTDCMSPDFLCEEQPIPKFRLHMLKDFFGPAQRVEFVSEFDVHRCMRLGGVLNWFETIGCGGGYIELSPIEFDASSTRAVVYVGFPCFYALCGNGYYVTMIRGASGWVFEEEKMAWVS